jgi:hypothetical protein
MSDLPTPPNTSIKEMSSDEGQRKRGIFNARGKVSTSAHLRGTDMNFRFN